MYLAKLTLQTHGAQRTQEKRLRQLKASGRQFKALNCDQNRVEERITKDRSRTQARDNSNGATPVKYLGNPVGSTRIRS